MRTRTCYFAKRPDLFTSDLLVPLLFCGYTVYSIQCSCCLAVSRPSDYVVCAVAAKGDVFEGVMVCFTRASSCGPTGGRRL